MLSIRVFGPCGALGNFSYLIESSFNKEAFIVDPTCSEEIINWVETHGVKPVALINTHDHYDHTEGNKALLSQYSELSVHTGTCDESILDTELKDSIFVISTPGHTDRDISLLVISEGQEIGLICGDTIFHGGVGNCRSGDPRKLYHSIQKIVKFVDGETPLYFGHDYMETNLKFILNQNSYHKVVKQLLEKKQKKKIDLFPTTINQEKRYNLFFDCLEEEFLELRILRDSWV